jgi:hypothetical protein
MPSEVSSKYRLEKKYLNFNVIALLLTYFIITTIIIPNKSFSGVDYSLNGALGYYMFYIYILWIKPTVSFDKSDFYFTLEGSPVIAPMQNIVALKKEIGMKSLIFSDGSIFNCYTYMYSKKSRILFESFIQEHIQQHTADSEIDINQFHFESSRYNIWIGSALITTFVCAYLLLDGQVLALNMLYSVLIAISLLVITVLYNFKDVSLGKESLLLYSHEKMFVKHYKYKNLLAKKGLFSTLKLLPADEHDYIRIFLPFYKKQSKVNLITALEDLEASLL